MDASDFRRHLQREVASYAAGLRVAHEQAAWDRPIAACPCWSVRTLTDHLIGIHYWVRDVISGRTGLDLVPPTATNDELPAAFAESAHRLIAALDQDADTPCWTFGDPQLDTQKLGFWQRRQPHEHQIHRWDLETALDTSLTVDRTLDPALAADGIDEVVTFFWPRQVALGRATAPLNHVAITETDTGHTWLLGSLTSTTTPIATLSGRAEDVLLALWKRLPSDHEGLAWSGDIAAGHAIVSHKLVP